MWTWLYANSVAANVEKNQSAGRWTVFFGFKCYFVHAQSLSLGSRRTNIRTNIHEFALHTISNVFWNQGAVKPIAFPTNISQFQHGSATERAIKSSNTSHSVFSFFSPPAPNQTANHGVSRTMKINFNPIGRFSHTPGQACAKSPCKSCMTWQVKPPVRPCKLVDGRGNHLLFIHLLLEFGPIFQGHIMQIV